MFLASVWITLFCFNIDCDSVAVNSRRSTDSSWGGSWIPSGFTTQLSWLYGCGKFGVGELLSLCTKLIWINDFCSWVWSRFYLSVYIYQCKFILYTVSAPQIKSRPHLKGYLVISAPIPISAPILIWVSDSDKLSVLAPLLPIFGSEYLV